MLVIRLALLTVSLLCCGQLSARTLEQLDYYSEEFFPYNYLEQGQAVGFSVELLALIFAQLESPAPEVKIVPWTRGYATLQHQAFTVLFSTIKTPQRADRFEWACPINVSRGKFYGLTDSELEITSLKDAENLKIAIMKGQAIDGFLTRSDFTAELIPVKSVEQAFRLLALRRVDLIALTEQSLEGHQSSFKPLYTLFEHDYCFAFNRSISQQELARFQAALEQVRQSDAFEKLYQKYFY
ncbi:ABC transporter substrate-binding protein [Agarivorans sp. Alg241-V36]|uniref:substrate-binding periplasmic protein n=1 Tax=Agarivorans sp. Alg241-V36 TaxID=2305992 RepID=UPI0013D4591C|nr:transporter substrate-binding domain-containing protein [Agarivorans sp. Alg241-V36]